MTQLTITPEKINVKGMLNGAIDLLDKSNIVITASDKTRVFAKYISGIWKINVLNNGASLQASDDDSLFFEDLDWLQIGKHKINRG